MQAVGRTSEVLLLMLLVLARPGANGDLKRLILEVMVVVGIGPIFELVVCGRRIVALRGALAGVHEWVVWVWIGVVRMGAVAVAAWFGTC